MLYSSFSVEFRTWHRIDCVECPKVSVYDALCDNEALDASRISQLRIAIVDLLESIRFYELSFLVECTHMCAHN